MRPGFPAKRSAMSDLAIATESPSRSPLAAEVARRRTFAIISHPDAGKTTLTEKLLLFGGAINLAGQVKAKGERRNTRSDWMKIEREGGISAATSARTREFEGPGSRLLRGGGAKAGAAQRVDIADLAGRNANLEVGAIKDELALVSEACKPFELEAFREGHLTPVYFGSALRNFGVGDLLEGLGRFAP